MSAHRVILSLSDAFLADVDRLAARELRSRTEILREALELYVTSRKAWRPLDEPAFRRELERRAVPAGEA